MSKRAEDFAREYADKKLQAVDPELWETGYTRYRKMSVRVMDGSDVEQAYQDGYEQAEKEMIDRAAAWIRANWREYIMGPDKDGSIGFGHWENDFREAMKDK